ncbi:MAG: hypothetical protein KDC44_02430, partial [Phaeodactylibacter sp.]|nr:hypothetical protein [Phaeodactylibacter sp.]
MYEVPNYKTIIAYLKSRDWKIVGNNSRHCTMRPPKALKFEDDFVYRIALHTDAPDYKEYATRQVFSIAELYGEDKWTLLKLLSQSLDQIKEDVALKQALLANAS